MKTIHSYSNKHQKELQTFLVFLPIIIFVLALVAIYLGLPQKQISQSEYAPRVLGEETRMK